MLLAARGPLLVRIAAYLRPEGVRRLVERLLDGLLADALEEGVVLTWIAVATVGRAVETRREALAVELEAARVATVAGLAGHGRRRWELGCERLRSQSFAAGSTLRRQTIAFLSRDGIRASRRLLHADSRRHYFAVRLAHKGAHLCLRRRALLLDMQAMAHRLLSDERRIQSS